ncbi:DEAD/DEAH box helicase [Pontibacterium sp. N1Y112]|uniref:DEAD-box ATP-dependent RNA helicase RhpA n=1 Tax=Pontibacterium sinense TaxID=2781979 RepID=A0A8J7K8Q2_9GAMM|nr:DEAD/DEAH box helicase [Pontibacterium sinense]MBE9399401.1 DEAD/DEAH box helicase [Pontibacterium sinense]
MSFASLGLSEFLVRALDEQGYEQPTPVQDKAIPAILNGGDVVAAAQTGSGKTAGFALPILETLSQRPAQGVRPLRALVLVPTRELAVQVGESIKTYAQYLPESLKIMTVYGGVSINPQMMGLRGGCDVMIATPGRLLDLLDNNATDLKSVETLVLDEADRMLDLGFADELGALLKLLPRKRQNLLFSATFPDGVKHLTQTLLVDPTEIEIKIEATIPEQVQQRAIEVDRTNRTTLLKQLIKEENWSRVIVFVASKRSANNVALKLSRVGITATALHGDLNQAARTKALADFKSKSFRVLVATDLASRGIDIVSLPCVVNYDLPRSPSDYVHRIGRTGRAGESGVALSFIDHESDNHFKVIEKRIKQKIPRENIEGLERSPYAPVELLDKKGPVKGKRKSKKDKLREAAARAQKNG